MRFFSVKIICACILLPPALYLITVAVLERQVNERLARQIEEIYLGEPQALLDGSIRLEEALEANIDRYLAASFLAKNGFALRVSVITRSGKFVYPSPSERVGAGNSDVREVAIENFALLSEGLVVNVEARLEHNRFISNLILSGYVLAALTMLLLHYRSAGRKISREEDGWRREMNRLVAVEQSSNVRLSELQQQREKLMAEFGNLKSALHNERERAERNEDDLIAEIDSLEKKLAENLRLQEAQQAEIQAFKEKVVLFEKEQRHEDKGRQKAAASFRKRFVTLYKNIQLSERAVEGFADLNEEMRLRAEEVIHQLNAAPDLVAVKRKVFGKKNRETVLEVVFAYRGRLYFRRGADRRVEIVAIGTKNTQERELEFLASL
jgi:hypothetical protein